MFEGLRAGQIVIHWDSLPDPLPEFNSLLKRYMDHPKSFRICTAFNDVTYVQSLLDQLRDLPTDHGGVVT